MAKVLFAVFVAPEGVPALLMNVEGDHNDQNLGDAFVEMYRDSLAQACPSDPFSLVCPGEVREVDDNVFFCPLPSGMGRNVGTMVAGYIGFERDYVQEGSEHFVVYFETDSDT